MPQREHLLILVDRSGTVLLALGIIGVLAANVIDWLQRRRDSRNDDAIAGPKQGNS